jgi:hypothetical protein
MNLRVSVDGRDGKGSRDPKRRRRSRRSCLSHFGIISSHTHIQYRGDIPCKAVLKCRDMLLRRYQAEDIDVILDDGTNLNEYTSAVNFK